MAFRFVVGERLAKQRNDKVFKGDRVLRPNIILTYCLKSCLVGKLVRSYRHLIPSRLCGRVRGELGEGCSDLQ